jgi:hypothetical protein
MASQSCFSEGQTKPLLLVLGFSHKSDEDFKKWADSARTPFVSDPRIDYYELADLEGEGANLAVTALADLRSTRRLACKPPPSK